MTEIVIKVHDVAEDGLPDLSKDETFDGRVAFVFNDAVVSGWPHDPARYGASTWETVFDDGLYSNVKYWLEFPPAFFEAIKEDR